MRIFSLTCTFLILFVSNTLAISSVQIEGIKEAQEYGKSKMQEASNEFLMPWTSYEEKAVTLNDTAEHAYLYTTFLLMAADAREKNLKGQSVNITDSDRILADYTDSLSFSVVLFADKPDFAQNAKVVIKQGKNLIKAYQINIPPTAENISKDVAQPAFKTQCFFYFSEKDIKLDAPIILSITTNDKREHSFYFDMAKIK